MSRLKIKVHLRFHQSVLCLHVRRKPQNLSTVSYLLVDAVRNKIQSKRARLCEDNRAYVEAKCMCLSKVDHIVTTDHSYIRFSMRKSWIFLNLILLNSKDSQLTFKF